MKNETALTGVEPMYVALFADYKETSCWASNDPL